MTAPDFGSGTTDTSTPDNVNTGGPAESMQETCTDIASLDDETKYTCAQICQPATCCFYDDVDCEKHIDCQFYSFCENLVNLLGGGGGSGTSNHSNGVDELDLKTDDIIINTGQNNDNHSDSPSDVQIACHDITTPTGLDQCYFHCSDYRCCFQDDFDPISCHARGICNQYKPCEKLEDIIDTPSSYPKPTVNMAAACNIHLISGQSDPFYEQNCVNLCQPAECCRDNACRQVNE